MTYRYDPLGRLISALYPVSTGHTHPTCVEYGYDAAGNRTKTSTATGATPPEAPIAINLYASAFKNTATTFDPRSSVPTCGSLTITAVGTPGHGTASIVNNNTEITYTPSSGWTGADSFSYTVSDGANPAQSGTLTVTTAANAIGPTALPAGLIHVFYTQVGHPIAPSWGKDITSSFGSPVGSTTNITSVTPASSGTSSSTATTVSYAYPSQILDGQITDSFTYTVTDAQGNTATSTVNVNFIVSCTNC
ncbi:MAG TPA: Ig-like domain-containing protein [Caulobacteraceae bacterium]|nr:Ig-like domain-containing protein [Caulobacteraceae bacterium]